MRDKPVDAASRERALALEQSFLVRAPAGSGKTDLLTRRYLKLLAAVDEPEEILAITFTRAATAEMRARVLGHLREAAEQAQADDDERVRLARAALEHAEARGWRLLEQPHRLNIETIDSLCLRIAHNQPLLSRMGGSLSPSEHAEALYAESARRTLGRLGTANAELNAALTHLLEVRDNNLPDCERLLAGMLAQRDQWIRAFPLVGNMSKNQWDSVRSRLEQPFREEVRRVHTEVYELLTSSQLGVELFELAQYACGNGSPLVATLLGVQSLPRPEAMAVEHWRCLCRFLLTEDKWRSERGLNITSGFPSKMPEQKRMKARMGALLGRLQQIPGLREALCAARDLPEPRYEERQWETLRAIFMTLRRAVAELRVLFAERNTVDFTELSIAAQDVLENAEGGPDALMALSGNIRHLLVDEFQDTSRSQHRLLELLIRAWEQEDGRTCFLVGDPMQSVYLFRQAEVELFDKVRREGLVSEAYRVEFESLELSTNFRSHEGLTARWNEMFEAVFAAGDSRHAAQIEYSHSYAAEAALPEKAVIVHPQLIGGNGPRPAPEEKEQARKDEAQQVLEIVAEHWKRIKQAEDEGGEYRVAVLVRSRPHLAHIVALLRERGVPFRAVDLEKLTERQELLDLLSLVRALLHPMDRVAWLSVLRAPWCGLTLEDLHALTGADDPAYKYLPVLELVKQRLSYLSADGAARLERVASILKRALDVRFQGLHAKSFSQWIERTWRSLGGPLCVDAAARENVEVFFAMLDTITPDGMACLTEDFEAEMERLFAQPDPRVSERAGVQLMTIHKAKGLGFDVVIVPGLDRRAAQDKQPLIVSLERAHATTGEPEMLVAPIGYRGKDKHPTYAWVQRQRMLRSDEELKRLLYVACTRARKSLHLLGTATICSSGLRPGDPKSLLATAWPALEQDFVEALKAREEKVIPFLSMQEKPDILDLAAAAESSPRMLLRRLPLHASAISSDANIGFVGIGPEMESEFTRPEGSRDARRKGSVVHALLDQVSRGIDVESLPILARSLLRGLAYSGKALTDAVVEVVKAVQNCLSEPDGAWVLARHAEAQSEASWTGWNDGVLETLRADRVFLAGPEPHTDGQDHLWIVDYKMSAPAGNTDFMAQQRAVYAPQLARYARAVGEALGINLPVRFALYFPRIAKLDWWSGE